MTIKLPVQVAGGTVEGTWQRGVATFRGIPFAGPPVGVNRFAPPRPPRRWDGVRDASRFGPAPPHPDNPTSGDDWLTLAVWTPDPGAGAGLPVIVWISGGAYLRCDIANPDLDGTLLAASGAVVVAVNYRTGAEGFAHLDGFPDNRGLLDQIAALGWVQDNVAAFGGDPSNVTVFGQSAGAGSIAALLAMPAAAGLIDRAVLQSLPATYFSTALAADIAAHLRTCSPRQADPRIVLADLEPDELVAATTGLLARLGAMAHRWGPVALTPTPFSPVVDGHHLPTDPWSALTAGAPSGGGKVPLLVGHVRDEFRLLAQRLSPPHGETLEGLLDMLTDSVDAQHYRQTFPNTADEQLREMIMADWLLRMSTMQLADDAHAGGHPVWVSELRWDAGGHGATHGMDTLLVFGTAEYLGEVTSKGAAVLDQCRQLSNLMRAETLAFATHGDPGWAPYHPAQSMTRVYDTTPGVAPYPERASRTIWRDHQFSILDRQTRTP